MQVSQTHGARVLKAIGIGIGYVDTIFTLTDQHGTFSESGAQDPLAPFLKLVPTSLSNLEALPPCSLRVAQYAATLKTLFLMTDPGSARAASR